MRRPTQLAASATRPGRYALLLALLLLLCGAAPIEAASATVTIGDLNQVYSGNPCPVTVTTDPAGLSVAVTYNGANSAPVYPGSYYVIATTTDANYRASNSATEIISTSASTGTTTSSGSTANSNSSGSGSTGNSDSSSSSTSGAPCGLGSVLGVALAFLVAVPLRCRERRGASGVAPAHQRG